MFDALKQLGGMGNPLELLKKAGEMRQRMETLQEQLAADRVTADAGGGAVTATVSGKMELISLKISRDLLPPGDPIEMIEDLTIAAVAAAQQKAAEHVQQRMAAVAGDLGLPPGMLGGM